MITLETPCLDSALRAQAEFIGADLWVAVSGGPAPHIGSVSVAVPRESLSGNRQTSATVSTINLVGHKDDAVGNLFAARLASVFHCHTSVSCGIHFENPSPEDIGQIVSAAEALLSKLVAALGTA